MLLDFQWGEMKVIIITKSKLSEAEVLAYLSYMKKCTTEPFYLNDKKFSITTHFDIALCSEKNAPADDFPESVVLPSLIESIDNDSISYFSKQLKHFLTKEMEIRTSLINAIESNEFYLVFQPQFYTSTNKLRGFEALVRWNSKIFGNISPAEFIPIAEETHLIIPLGQWILENAFIQFKEIQAACSDRIILSVNLSVLQLLNSDFLQTLSSIIKKTNFPTEYLEIEVTESVFIDSMETVTNILEKIKSLGIRIALDDFGAGHTSLSYLQKMPISTLKIDKSLIDNLTVITKRDHVIEAVIALAHKMKMQVIAEGVETIFQLQYLESHSCDCIQGFFLGKPQQKDVLCELLENKKIII